MINATAVNAITSGENEKVKWWEKNGVVTVKLKSGVICNTNEVVATNLPPSITGESCRFIGVQTNNVTLRHFIIDTNGNLTTQFSYTNATTAPIFGMYQC